MVTPPFSQSASPLILDGLAGTWGSFCLHPVDLSIEGGEYLVIVGPSGCGKTTIAELVCGLRRSLAGRIILGSEDITRVDPAARHIGYVPQDYELFPAMTVEQNVRFASRVKKIEKTSTEKRFGLVVNMLGIETIMGRRVTTLSGGERQRVALGRALMADPDVLILDEPVSALPESLRNTVCEELRRLHTTVGLTTVHISHNLDEALMVADRLAVMDTGRIAQVGTPTEILDQPADRFVAEFTCCENIWPVIVRNRRVVVGDTELCETDQTDGSYWAAVRAEHVQLDGDAGHGSTFTGEVIDMTRSAHGRKTTIQIGPTGIVAHDDRPRTVGDRIQVTIPVRAVTLFPRGK